MRYIFLLAFVLQCLGALAQVDSLQSKAAIEAYVKRQYHYKAVTLQMVNPVIQDSNFVSPPQPAYWLKADFNHDGRADLFISAMVSTRKQKENVLFILASEGKRYVKVNFINPEHFHDRLKTSYATCAESGKNYLAITTLVRKLLPREKIRRGHSFTCYATHDTVFVQKGRPMMYAAHPLGLATSSVQFSATACYGTCPVFQVAIDRDGAVDYKGTQYVSRLGEFKLKMSSADFEYLTSLLAAINPLCLQNRYSIDWTDNPTVYLTVHYANGQQKAIEDYGEEGTYGLVTLYQFLLALRNF